MDRLLNTEKSNAKLNENVQYSALLTELKSEGLLRGCLLTCFLHSAKISRILVDQPISINSVEIHFNSKEESKQIQQEEFLKLKPIERLYHFFKMMEASKDLPVKKAPEKGGNLILELKREN